MESLRYSFDDQLGPTLQRCIQDIERLLQPFKTIGYLLLLLLIKKQRRFPLVNLSRPALCFSLTADATQNITT